MEKFKPVWMNTVSLQCVKQVLGQSPSLYSPSTYLPRGD